MARRIPRAYSRYTQEAARLLGARIKLARKERKMSESDLADRVGISRLTLRKIESGNLHCEIGLAFEAATLVGVRLFHPHTSETTVDIEHIRDKIALLPKAIRQPRNVDDDF